MISLVAAAMVFAAIHLLVSGTPLRDRLTARLGESAYLGLFSLASAAGLIWMGWAYATVRNEPANTVFWGVTPETRNLQVVLTFIALMFILPGLLTSNPTSVRSEAVLDRPDAVQGMLRITRHPFLWGISIWAAGHLVVNGDLASFVLFGTMLVLGLLGPISIDAKRRRALGDQWTAFAARTSNIPFAAILTGRQAFRPVEIGWRILPAIIVWGAIAHFHALLFGVRALP